MNQSHILYLEDDERLARAVIRRLVPAFPKHQFLHLSATTALLETLSKHSVKLILLDLALDQTDSNAETDYPDRESFCIDPHKLCGIVQIPNILEIHPHMPIVVLSGHNYSESIDVALGEGAVSFVPKPTPVEELIAIIRDRLRASEHIEQALKRNNASGRLNSYSRTASEHYFSELIGHSRLSKKLMADALFAASNTIPVMILGEPGTGKSSLAFSIHQSMHSTRAGALVRFSPSFASQDLIMSELFGHARGAFTGATNERRGLFEESNGGSLLIDEIGELPTAVQILLLDVLQRREFRKLGTTTTISSDFRLLSATNLPRTKLATQLRPDFLHRAGHITLEIPPLRQRMEDLKPIANRIFARALTRHPTKVHSLSSATLKLLEHHDWPGNIRELQAVIETAIARADFQSDKVVLPQHISINLMSRKQHEVEEASRTKILYREQPFTETAEEEGHLLRRNLRQLEKITIANALHQTGGNQREAAALLGIDRGTLRRALRRF